MERVHIGQKLILEDLIDSEWQKKYAEPALLVSMLKECGISFVEFGLSPETDDKEVVRMAEVFADAGLFISLDLQYNGSPGLIISDSLSFLNEKLNTAQIVGNITRVPVPYVFRSRIESQSQTNIKQEEAIKDSRSYFAWIDRVVSEEFGNIVALCKTWSYHPDRWKNNLNCWQSYLQAIHGTNLGVCWDFGDTFLSMTQSELNQWPGDHFLARVNHVQAYDAVINKDGVIDHLPLTDGKVPWREYCSLLARYDYDSTIVLDVDPEYYYGIDSFLHGVRDGIKKLRAFFD